MSTTNKTKPKQDNEWITPLWLMDLVRVIARPHPIALDPFPAAGSHVRPRWRLRNGLGRASWAERAAGGLVWVNPPYSRDLLGACVARCITEAKLGAHVLALVPSSTDTAWFHATHAAADQMCFLRGRVKFEGRADFGPLFPSVLIHFAGERGKWEARNKATFRRVFEDRGIVVTLGG
jgi:hypothetical protein